MSSPADDAVRRQPVQAVCAETRSVVDADSTHRCAPRASGPGGVCLSLLTYFYLLISNFIVTYFYVNLLYSVLNVLSAPPNRFLTRMVGAY